VGVAQEKEVCADEPEILPAARRLLCMIFTMARFSLFFLSAAGSYEQRIIVCSQEAAVHVCLLATVMFDFSVGSRSLPTSLFF